MSGRNRGRGGDDAPLSERAATAARAELRGERTGILGATGETTLRSLVRAHRVPSRWSAAARLLLPETPAPSAKADDRGTPQPPAQEGK
jgi:hypothetical protein